jgi:hypothetical protein
MSTATGAAAAIGDGDEVRIASTSIGAPAFVTKSKPASAGRDGRKYSREGSLHASSAGALSMSIAARQNRGHSGPGTGWDSRTTTRTHRSVGQSECDACIT